MEKSQYLITLRKFDGAIRSVVQDVSGVIIEPSICPAIVVHGEDVGSALKRVCHYIQFKEDEKATSKLAS